MKIWVPKYQGARNAVLHRNCLTFLSAPRNLHRKIQILIFRQSLHRREHGLLPFKVWKILIERFTVYRYLPTPLVHAHSSGGSLTASYRAQQFFFCVKLGHTFIKLVKHDPAHANGAEFILGKHFHNRETHNFFWIFFNYFLRWNLLQTTWMHGVVAIYFLFKLFSCKSNFINIGNNYLISPINMGLIARFMLTHENASNLSCQTSWTLSSGIKLNFFVFVTSHTKRTLALEIRLILPILPRLHPQSGS